MLSFFTEDLLKKALALDDEMLYLKSTAIYETITWQ